MQKFILPLLLACTFNSHAWNLTTPQVPKPTWYALKIYQLKTPEQQDRVEKFLRNAYLPALHRLGIPQAGVFIPLGNDTAATRRIFVLIPFRSMEAFATLPTSLSKDKQYLEAGKDYLDAHYDNPSYLRIESILLEAFPEALEVQKPGPFPTPDSLRIYELRSYEGPTESYFSNKVQMFNKGGEVTLFHRLGFNAVFYASVFSGAHMPNLMYMTSFQDMASREAHWKAFFSDPAWTTLSASPEYQHNVSHVDITFMHPTAYSDL